MVQITLDEVITYQNFFSALKDCNRTVNFKYSVQKYNTMAANIIAEDITAIRAGRIPEITNARQIVIFERGKKRVITPIDIRDRAIQKVLCEKVLLPSITPYLIYDNGASLKGKGTDFARKRLNLFLEKAKRKYGAANVYALVFDFRNYFDSIPHRECYRVLKKYVSDERLVRLVIGIIESYKLQEINSMEDPGEKEDALRRLKNHEWKGICLGSQISQIMAVAVPNDFDHYIKEKLRMKYYVRYMDDGIILHNDKDKLNRIVRLLKEEARKYGLELHERKTYVTKATKGFTFLKIKYHFDGDRTVKRLTRPGIVRERRRLKAFAVKVRDGSMSLDDVYNNMQSWNAHSAAAKCYKTTRSMFELYDREFGGYRMTRRFYREHPEEKRERKVVRV